MMSTHRLYYDDSYLQNFEARLMNCSLAEPVAGDAGAQPAWEVVLEETAFYPTSGGQPHDLGLLNDAVVLDVREEGEDVVHIVDREVETRVVKGCINWPRRFDHMQQHSGQHLLSSMFQERFGLPTVSFHLGQEICTIDLRGREPGIELLMGAQRATNKAIFESRAVTVRYGTAEDLARLGVRKQVQREGILRAIEIESADLQPCGGTHVKSSAEIGIVLVRGCTKVRQDWRVEFVCGGRAERLASADLLAIREVAGKLGCTMEESVVAIEKLVADRDAHFKNLRLAREQWAIAVSLSMMAEATVEEDGTCIVARVWRQEDPDLLLPLATELAKGDKTVALLAHEGTGQLVFAQSDGRARDLNALVKLLFETYPGKGGGTRNFVRAKLTDAAACTPALELARKLLSR
jgi:alanyl-tRNA synthetase